jgi:hypothetical protein
VAVAKKDLVPAKRPRSDIVAYRNKDGAIVVGPKPKRGDSFLPQIDQETGDVTNLPAGFRPAEYHPPPVSVTERARCPVLGCSSRVLPEDQTRHAIDHTWRYLTLPDLPESELVYLIRLVDGGRPEILAERIKLEGKRLRPPRDLNIVDQDLPCAVCHETIPAGSPLEHVKPLRSRGTVAVHPHCPTPTSPPAVSTGHRDVSPEPKVGSGRAG